MNAYKKERLIINNWAVALLVIGNHETESIVSLAKRMDCTYSSLASTTMELERRNILRRERQGRMVGLTLTDKGREIYEALRTIAQRTNLKNYQGWVINEWGIVAKQD